MTLSVLIVEPDVEVLGDLASRLRALGLEVSIADDERLAVERARRRRPDAIVIEKNLAEGSSLVTALQADRQLSSVPRILIADGPTSDETVDRRDAAGLAKRLYAAMPRSRASAAREGDFRGDLTQVSVVDLLQLLSMNRRSGALSVSTSRGAGEVRLGDGEILDAVYQRHEGEKALFRLLSETDGSFAFSSGEANPLRRITTPTSALLMEGMRQADEVRALRTKLGDGGFDLVTAGQIPDDLSEVEARVVETLESPRSLEEVLDETSDGDLAVLGAVASLLRRNLLRRVDSGSRRAELGDPDRLQVLAALVKRLTRDGFSGGARLVFAGEPRRLAALGHAVGRIAQASVPAGAAPTTPVPHVLAVLQLPEGAELELFGLPLVDAFGALWGLSLPGSAAVVLLSGAQSALLDEVAGLLGTPVIDAEALVGELDEASSLQAAALVQSALQYLADR